MDAPATVLDTTNRKPTDLKILTVIPNSVAALLKDPAAQLGHRSWMFWWATLCIYKRLFFKEV
jgi:hypothetical protein